MMSPTKCNNSVFLNNTISESNKIKLTLFNDCLQINDNPIFLGIRFDNKLSFVNHINYVQWCENYDFLVKCRFVTQICVILRCNFTFLMFFYVTRKINNFCKITNNHPQLVQVFLVQHFLLPVLLIKQFLPPVFLPLQFHFLRTVSQVFLKYINKLHQVIFI